MKIGNISLFNNPPTKILFEKSVQDIKSKNIFKDVQIDHSQKWKKNHWKSLESAYRSSPYFEYYEDDFKSIVPTHNLVSRSNVEPNKSIFVCFC